MACEWARTTLAQAGVTLIDCDHRTPPATEAGYPYIAIPQLKDGRIELSGVRRISAAHYADWTKKLKPQDHDVIVVRRCNSGDSAVVQDSLECAIGQNLVVLRADGTKVLPAYLRWLLRGPDWWNEVGKYINVGAVFDSLKCRDIPNFEVAIPPIDAQREIASFLGALDDRIDLLRQTNTTLEALAQALFKSWFVDFDPVHAKAEGREPEASAQECANAAQGRMPIAAMDAATAALFPSEFEESELGLIPKGWSLEPIGEMVEGIYDGPHATPPEADEGPIFLGIKNLTGSALDLSEIRHIAEDHYAQWARRVTPRAGDIVFSYEATLGFFALIPESMRCCLGRRLALVRPRQESGNGHFWFHQFVASPFQRMLERHTIQGATVNRISLKEFPSYLVLDPTEAIKSAFESMVALLWKLIHSNQAKSETLVALRDTLLPRLISGKLRLPEVKTEVEQVAAEVAG